jgi:zeta-carotene desaturase
MPRKAIVVGGGWAGCAAAFRLAQAGWKVALFEKSAHLGGRASSFVLPGRDLELDNGQHLFLGAYRRTLEMLGGLGTAGQIEFQAALEVPFFLPGGRCEILRAGGSWGPFGLLSGLNRLAHLDAPEKAALKKLGLRGGWDLVRAKVGLMADSGQSAAQWLGACGQPGSLIAKFWEPLCLAALNAPSSQVQAGALMTVLAQGFLAGGGKSGLGFSKVPLNRLLDPALKSHLEARGGELHLHTGADQLQVEGGRVRRLRTEEGKEYSAQAFVLALPHHQAGHAFAPEWSQSLGLEGVKAWPCSPILSVQLWTGKPLLPKSFGAFQSVDGRQPAFHWAFDKGERTSFVSSAAIDLAHLDKAQVLERLYAQLESYLPSFDRAGVRESLVLKEMRATPLLKPGSSALRLDQKTSIANLALAGDWTATGLPATIEGAVVSGFKAAEALV